MGILPIQRQRIPIRTGSKIKAKPPQTGNFLAKAVFFIVLLHKNPKIKAASPKGYGEVV